MPSKSLEEYEQRSRELISTMIIASVTLSLLAGATSFCLLIVSYSGIRTPLHNYLLSPLALFSLALFFLYLFVAFDKIKRVDRKSSIIIRTVAIATALIGLIPVVEASFVQNIPILIYYIIDVVFVLAFPKLVNIQRSYFDSGWTSIFIPADDTEPVFLKVTYYGGRMLAAT